MTSFECQLVGWLRERVSQHVAVPLGIGDDMAAVRLSGDVLWVSADLLLDGVHFDTSKDTFDLIGRKALACGLSDCAAMAVRPIAATVSLAWDRRYSIEKAKAFFEGMLALADEYSVALAGGDTTTWSSPCAFDVTILAESHPGIKPIRRDGAQPGDRLFVTGPLGGSIRGKHLRFAPRVEYARSLAQTLGGHLHAMMDISDGLSLDLWRMCRTSGVGAQLDESLLEHVISGDAHALSQDDGQSALDHALSDGEDFELLMAVDPSASFSNESLIEVGRITENGFSIKRLDGTVAPLEPEGYWH